MAKKDSDKKTVSTSKTPAKQTGKLAAAPARQPSRSDSKHSATPRGTVSTKPVGRLRTFFREVRVEMKKVTWPTRKELVKSTGVVLFAVAIAAAFIGLCDWLWVIIVEQSHLGG